MIRPVILSGGSGTRLWPLSRQATPKQFHSLVGPSSMFQATLERLDGSTDFLSPYIVANASHRDIVTRQLAGAGLAAGLVILEPLARNTAPAIALAALLQVESDPGVPLLVMPSDHMISRNDVFLNAIANLGPLVEQGNLATFGIVPDRPETGFGYIQRGEPVGDGLFKVARFIEKPEPARAAELVAAGDCYWNSGIFLFRADSYLSELRRQQPAMLEAAEAALKAARHEGNAVLPDAEAFASCPSDSIDYAIMEGSDRVVVAPVDLGWSDVGSWDALFGVKAQDEHGNVLSENVISLETANCMIHSSGPTVTALGVSDLIIVATKEAILILRKGDSQGVKQMVDLVRQERPDLI